MDLSSSVLETPVGAAINSGKNLVIRNMILKIHVICISRGKNSLFTYIWNTFAIGRDSDSLIEINSQTMGTYLAIIVRTSLAFRTCQARICLIHFCAFQCYNVWHQNEWINKPKNLLFSRLLPLTSNLMAVLLSKAMKSEG